MNKGDIKKIGKGSLLGSEIVSSQTDPDFYHNLEILPNPDTVLRKLGKADETYLAIAQDAHVAGEMRSARAGLLKFETKIIAGGEQRVDKKAAELCQAVFDAPPAPNMIWADVLWNMAKAQYFGFVVHEIVWQMDGQHIVPARILDRKNKRFGFTPERELGYKIKNNFKLHPLADYRVLLTRHQPSAQNPYGLALLSSCFWPYTFKHMGFRSFTKFINKYGLPWPVGQYPDGSSDKDIEKLLSALAKMVEDGVMAIPEGNAVEFLETKGGGRNSPQEAFIRLCNNEMSKALTSQTMATEQQTNGSRAAGEVAREREESVDTSQRVIVEATMNKLFRLITEINIAGAKPPIFEFYEQDAAPTQWVEALEKAAGFMDVSKEYAHRVTGIPIAKNDDDKLAAPASSKAAQTAEFRQSELNDFDKAQQKQTDTIYRALSQAGSLAEFSKNLNEMRFDDDSAEVLALPLLDETIKGRNDT